MCQRLGPSWQAYSSSWLLSWVKPWRSGRLWMRRTRWATFFVWTRKPLSPSAMHPGSTPSTETSLTNNVWATFQPWSACVRSPSRREILWQLYPGRIRLSMLQTPRSIPTSYENSGCSASYRGWFEGDLVRFYGHQDLAELQFKSNYSIMDITFVLMASYTCHRVVASFCNGPRHVYFN